MRFLTVEAVASELSVHTSTVRRLIDAGTLPGVRLGDGDGRGQLGRVRACDLERFIAECAVARSPSVVSRHRLDDVPR